MTSDVEMERFYCSECLYYSHRRFDLKRHKYIHGGEYQCDKCEATFVEWKGLDSHHQYCLKMKSDKYKESVERRQSQSESSSASTSGSREGSRQAGDSVERKMEESVLESLKAITETEQKTFKCPRCPYKCTRKFDLKRHIKVHGEMHECKICHVAFNTSVGLASHKRDFCDSTAPQSRAKPATKIIMRDGRYCCGKCDQTFTILKNCERHQLGHTIEKQFECSYCQARFKRRDYLLEHERRHYQPGTRLKTTKELRRNVQFKNTGESSRKSSETALSRSASESNNYTVEYNDDDEFGGLLDEIITQDEAQDNPEPRKIVPKEAESKKTSQRNKLKLRNLKTIKYGCIECEVEFETNIELWDHLRVKHFL